MAAPVRLSRADAREQTRGRVLEAARDVFVREGFHRASTDAIARAAGYSRGALYANWRTKEDVFFAVLDAEIDARFALLEPPHEGTPAEQLRALARTSQRLLADDPGWSLLMIEFTAHAARHPEHAARLRERNARLVDQLAARLQARLGHTEAEARRAAHAVLVVQSGTAVERMASGDALPADVPEELAASLGRPPWRSG